MHSDTLLPGHRPFPGTWSALCGALILTCAVFWNVLPSITHAFPDDLIDPLNQAWLIAWYTHILPQDPTHLWDANMLYPTLGTFTFQDTLLGWAPIAMPLLLISGSLPLTYNVLFLLSFVLSLWFTFLCLRTLLRAAGYTSTSSAQAAFLGGVIDAFLPYKLSQLGHLNVLSAQWVPLIFLCWECAWRRGGGRWWIGLSLCLVLEVLCSLYIAAFCGVALAILFLLRLLGRQGWRHVPWFALGTTAALTAVALLPIWLPYSHTFGEMGHNRTMAEAISLAPSLRDLLHSERNSILYGWTDRLFPAGSLYAPQYLFPGVIPLALVGWAAWTMLRKSPAGRRAQKGAVASSGSEGGDAQPSGPSMGSRMSVATLLTNADEQRKRARSVLLPYLILWPCTIILAQGPLLRLAPNAASLAIPGPYLLLYRLVPGFQSLRDPGRFTIISGFCLALLAAAGLATLLDRLRAVQLVQRSSLMQGRSSVRSSLLALLITALVLLEYLGGSVDMQSVPVNAQIPAVYRWLAQQPTNEPVLELPIGHYDQDCWEYYYATYHWHPVVNGATSFAPAAYTEALPIWATFPSSAAMRLLHRWAIRYVIVHDEWIGASAARRIAQQAPAQGLRLVGQWGTDQVYEPLHPSTVLESRQVQ